MHWVPFLFFFVSVFFAHSSYAWQVVPAHQISYALRAKDEGNATDDIEYVEDFGQPRNSLHTIYKFGWCKPDVVQRNFLYRSSNYSIANVKSSDTQWIYVLDTANSRKFNLQCTVVKVYVRAQDQFKRTRIPFHYCQGSLYYLMLNTVARITIHEFYFMTRFEMPATFVFEYYVPSMV